MMTTIMPFHVVLFSAALAALEKFMPVLKRKEEKI